MAIAWITTKTDLHLIEVLRALQWEVKLFSPAEFWQAKLSQLDYVDTIIFDLTDARLLDMCREICYKKIAPMLVIVMDLAYAQAAIEVGVDDFLVVPINPIEGLLRVRKLTRATNVVRVGDLEIDLAACRVSSRGYRVRLSSFEFRLLACLAKRVGQTVTYAELIEDIWEWDPDGGTLAGVKDCINRVRKKIESDLQEPQYIITITREGYRLRNQRQWKESVPETAASNLMFYYDIEA